MTSVDPIEFGELKGLLTALSQRVGELADRVTWRQDNLEARVEALEQGAAKGSFSRRFLDGFIEKAVWAGIGAAALYGGAKVLP